MEEKAKEKTKEKSFFKNPISVLLIGLLAFALTFPLFLLVYQFVPTMNFTIGGEVRIDQIILFILLFVVLYLLIRKFKKFFGVVALLGLIALGVSNFLGVYTFNTMHADYQNMLHNLKDNSLETNFFLKGKSFKREESLRNAIDYANPEVINFARNIATKHFAAYNSMAENKRWIQFCSVFKEIKSKWIYVYDPLEEEYFSKASKTIELLDFNDKFKGDCDDYSILIAASIKAIGGEVRLVRTEVEQEDGTTIGHLYPEVKVGDKQELEKLAYLIRSVLFPKEVKKNPIRYYLDPQGNVWLNFDYNDSYPGGRYQSDVRVSAVKI